MRDDSKSCGGFTLLELMAAVGVAGVLVLTCGVLMKMGSADQQSIARELAWEREAGLVVEQLTEDLAAAYGRIWHEGRNDRQMDHGWLVLRPFGAQLADSAVGDLCAVAYCLQDDHLNGLKQVQRRLVRQQRDSAEVYLAMESGEEHALWHPASSLEPLAQGVLVFELWPLIGDGPDAWQPWHPELRPLPDAVELRLVLASPRLQERLGTVEEWDLAAMNPGQFDGGEIREVRTLIHLGGDAD